MSDDKKKGFGRRQLIGGGLAAVAVGALSTMFPELANAETRTARGITTVNDDEWYLQEPESSTELDDTTAKQHAAALTATAGLADIAAKHIDSANSANIAKSAIRTYKDGRTITVTGTNLSDTRAVINWQEHLADGSVGRSATAMYDVTKDTATLVGNGGSVATLQAVTAAAGTDAVMKLKCPVGTYAVRLCSSMDLAGFGSCCGGCVVAFVGSPLAGFLCATIVCSSCYVKNCKKWVNTCAANH
ncbi:hypothetical protein NYQ31_01890 [Curtobacterium flaccumfaciens]|jgi:hypothetical protein|uniref:hypothetical protein n=1 Tax=Curtobacterium flaccumfaciens TaxID=2035 RepID=UPI00217DE780|nr:hypothetical protein [Curtobacterium flaccumfaciens]MCS6557144.1 hypothetical protein [Curtobacterium flaccumfaciens]